MEGHAYTLKLNLAQLLRLRVAFSYIASTWFARAKITRQWKATVTLASNSSGDQHEPWQLREWRQVERGRKNFHVSFWMIMPQTRDFSLNSCERHLCWHKYVISTLPRWILGHKQFSFLPQDVSYG